jgi:arylsulfatase A-like enzyme
VNRPALRLGLIFAAATALGCSRPPVPPHQNVLLIVIDTLRADHLPTYGYERNTAPFLAELATEGIALDGYAASSWTRPSIATMLTGLVPQRHQVIARSDELPADAPWLPEILHQQGFATVGYSANPNAGRRWGFARGFAGWKQNNLGKKADGSKVTNQFVRLAEGVAPRFFGYVLYVDPHAPYVPPEPWLDPGMSTWDYVQPQGLAREKTTPDATHLDRMRRQYDGEIRDVDQQIRYLLDELRSRGLLAGTLVVITADHGEEFGERGQLSHGKTLFEESVHVPLIFWSEALAATRRTHPGGRFHLVDLAPTLAEALAIPFASDLDGTSRWSELSRNRSPETSPMHFHLDLDQWSALALRRDDLKLIESVERSHRGLFDLEKDPGEQVPLSDAKATSDLRNELVVFHNERSAARLGRTSKDELDAETRAQLAALGYLGSETTAEDLRRRTIPDQLDPASGLPVRRDR